jgi:hypothetical protein
MPPNAWSIDQIRSTLRSPDAKGKMYAALLLCSMELDVHTLIPDLADAMERAAASFDGTIGAERTVLGIGAVALSNFLKQSQQESEVKFIAEQTLVSLAKSQNGDVAATGVNAIGSVGPNGMFCWDILFDIAERSQEKCLDRPVTLAALAYQAMLKIDFQRPIALGDIQAKAELKIAMQFWLTENTSDERKSEISAVLAKLQ